MKRQFSEHEYKIASEVFEEAAAGMKDDYAKEFINMQAPTGEGLLELHRKVAVLDEILAVLKSKAIDSKIRAARQR